MPDERNAELYSPPYLFKGPRPDHHRRPTLVGYGSRPSASRRRTPPNIAKVSLIRLGSVTHAFDMNQRFLWLPFTRGAGRSRSRLRRAAPGPRRATTCCSW